MSSVSAWLSAVSCTLYPYLKHGLWAKVMPMYSAIVLNVPFIVTEIKEHGLLVNPGVLAWQASWFDHPRPKVFRTFLDDLLIYRSLGDSRNPFSKGKSQSIDYDI